MRISKKQRVDIFESIQGKFSNSNLIEPNRGQKVQKAITQK